MNFGDVFPPREAKINMSFDILSKSFTKYILFD